MVDHIFVPDVEVLGTARTVHQGKAHGTAGGVVVEVKRGISADVGAEETAVPGVGMDSGAVVHRGLSTSGFFFHLGKSGDDDEGQNAADQGRDALGPGEHNGQGRHLLFGNGAQGLQHGGHAHPEEGALHRGGEDHRRDAKLLPFAGQQTENQGQNGVAAAHHRHNRHNGGADADQGRQNRGQKTNNNPGQDTHLGGKDKQDTVNKASGDQLGHGEGARDDSPGGQQLADELGQNHEGDADGRAGNKLNGAVSFFHSLVASSSLPAKLLSSACFFSAASL